MSTLNPNIPTPELARLLTDAAQKMGEFRLKLLTPQLLLHTFLQDEKSAAFQILTQLSQQRGFRIDELRQRVKMMTQHTPGRDANFNFTDDFGKDIPLADEMLVVLDEALSIAQAREELKAGSGHALAAMAQPNVTTYGALQRMGITAVTITALLDTLTQEGTPLLVDYLTATEQSGATAVYPRTDLLDTLTNLLALSSQRHVILVGPEGVGKRSLAISLAQRIAEGKGPADTRSLVQINEAALLENPLAAMRAGLRRASGGILLVPGIDRFFADRLRARFPEQVNRELHKALLGSEQIIIGTTTPASYDRLAQDALIRQHTQRLMVPAATRAETVQILACHQQRLTAAYNVAITPEALEQAAKLADQYIKTIAQPAAALQLTERACVLVQLVTENRITTTEQVPPDGTVEPEDVLIAASQMTGIPLSKLNPDEQTKYANMADHLHLRLIGQSEAVTAVSRAVKTARVGLRDPKRPIGSFLFLGPSGVGKTEMAKALAEFMFGSEEAMLVLDMSEYQEEASVNRLIGAPPGYVGFEGGGQLTNFVRERPYTVVLFDEVEKAHQRVFDVLLQVMEEGRLTDSHGRTATFSETVIIMTSNLGSQHMLVPVIGDRERELVMADVRAFFRPEWLNRLDDVVMFHQLTGDQLAKILDLMLKKEFRLAASQNIALTVTPQARQWLLAQNDEPQYGARPLRRIIARHLREPLANFLLTQKRDSAQTQVIVDHKPNTPELDFQIGAPTT